MALSTAVKSQQAPRRAAVATPGAQLRAARRQAGLSQDFLGKLIGATQQAVSRWEQDLGYPERTYWSALEEVLGVDVSAWARQRHVARR
jgi:transcriptional regulator with XRE-family HTH domain